MDVIAKQSVLSVFIGFSIRGLSVFTKVILKQ